MNHELAVALRFPLISTGTGSGLTVTTKNSLRPRVSIYFWPYSAYTYTDTYTHKSPETPEGTGQLLKGAEQICGMAALLSLQAGSRQRKTARGRERKRERKKEREREIGKRGKMEERARQTGRATRTRQEGGK